MERWLSSCAGIAVSTSDEEGEDEAGVAGNDGGEEGNEVGKCRGGR